jgi:hypothetical protein
VLFDFDNDNEAKAEIAALSDWIGFARIDLGSLGVGGKLAQFFGGPLPNQNSSTSTDRPVLARLGPAEVLAIRQLSGGKRTDLSATHSLAS